MKCFILALLYFCIRVCVGFRGAWLVMLFLGNPNVPILCAYPAI